MAATTSLAARPRARNASTSSQMRMLRSSRPKSASPATPGIVSSAGLMWRRTYSLTSVWLRVKLMGTQSTG